MELAEALAIVAAAIAAGAINTVVGSGTLITFPVLIALGYPPLIANVSNNVGLVPGSVAGAIGYRRELRGQRRRLLRFAIFSIAGSAAGAGLLLVLPASAFDAIVPALIALALALVIFQERITRAIGEHRLADSESSPVLRSLIGATGIYGGYFGAAQGVILISILGIAVRDELQRLNALKNVLAGLVNLTATVIFVVAAEVDWEVAGLIAGGSTLGAVLGARYGRRLSARALRLLIVVVGAVAIVRLTIG